MQRLSGGEGSAMTTGREGWCDQWGEGGAVTTGEGDAVTSGGRGVSDHRGGGWQ